MESKGVRVNVLHLELLHEIPISMGFGGKPLSLSVSFLNLILSKVVMVSKSLSINVLLKKLSDLLR